MNACALQIKRAKSGDNGPSCQAALCTPSLRKLEVLQADIEEACRCMPWWMFASCLCFAASQAPLGCVQEMRRGLKEIHLLTEVKQQLL